MSFGAAFVVVVFLATLPLYYDVHNGLYRVAPVLEYRYS